MEIFLIIVAVLIFKIFSVYKENLNLSDNSDTTTQTKFKYESSADVKDKIPEAEKIERVKLKNLEFNYIYKWLINPSPNRNIFSVLLINALLTEKDLSVINISKIIKLEMEKKDVNYSIEKLYTDLLNLWKMQIMNSEYVQISNSSFTLIQNLTTAELDTLSIEFKKVIKLLNGESFNKNRVLNDLNYLFEIIPQSNSSKFL